MSAIYGRLSEHTPTQEQAARGGRAPRRPYRYSLQDIADLKGKCVTTVRRDQQRGKFVASDLGSVVRYLGE